MGILFPLLARMALMLEQMPIMYLPVIMAVVKVQFET